jgi:hypothetical protein
MMSDEVTVVPQCRVGLAPTASSGGGAVVCPAVDRTGRALKTTQCAACPQCGALSRRVHAYVVRRLTDLPLAGRGLVMELRVRRLVCQIPGCPHGCSRTDPAAAAVDLTHVPLAARTNHRLCARAERLTGPSSRRPPGFTCWLQGPIMDGRTRSAEAPSSHGTRSGPA